MSDDLIEGKMNHTPEKINSIKKHKLAVDAALNSKEVSRYIQDSEQNASFEVIGIKTKFLGLEKSNPPQTLIETLFEFKPKNIGVGGSIKVIVAISELNNAELREIKRLEL
jgi:hypothetical protein